MISSVSWLGWCLGPHDQLSPLSPVPLFFYICLPCKMLTLELLSRHQIINHCFFHLWFGKPQKHWLTQKDFVTLVWRGIPKKHWVYWIYCHLPQMLDDSLRVGPTVHVVHRWGPVDVFIPGRATLQEHSHHVAAGGVTPLIKSRMSVLNLEWFPRCVAIFQETTMINLWSIKMESLSAIGNH